MKKKVITLTILISSCFWLQVAAAPTLHGSSGLLESPTADVLSPGGVSGGSWLGRDWSRQSLAVGLPGGWEVAHGWRSAAGETTEETNIKLALKSEGVLLPGLAVGYQQGGAAYAVASKFLPGGYRVHVGIGTERFRDGFGGVEKVLNPPHFERGKMTMPQPTVKAIVDLDRHGAQYGLCAAWQNGWQAQLAHGAGAWYGGITFNW